MPTQELDLENTLEQAVPGSQARRLNILLVALWLGLISGFVEVLVFLVRRFVLQDLIWANMDITWMAPLSAVIFLLIPAFLIHLYRRLRRSSGESRLAIPFLAFLATGNVLALILQGHIHVAAILLLTIGVAVQAGRLMQRYSVRFDRFMRRSIPVLAVLVILLAAGVTGWRTGVERLSQSRATPRKGAPNVLLIILDTVRSASLSLQGYGRPTSPNLERWAKKGVTFQRAYATAPWTLPSHASMFTGRYAHDLSFGWEQPLKTEHAVLPIAFREAGYRTGAFTANHFYTTREIGLARGFDRFVGRRITAGEIVLGSTLGQMLAALWKHQWIEERYSARSRAEEINAEFFDWLGNESRPFFAFLNYFDAHMEHYASPEYHDRFVDEAHPGETRSAVRSLLPRTRRYVEVGSRVLRDHYDASIAYIDAQVGILLDTLHARGILDNTIVIIAADHGEFLGEHGQFGHIGGGLYSQVLHVPLIVIAPGRAPAGVQNYSSVSLRDIAATAAHLSGLVRPARFDGASLSRFWNSDSANLRRSNDLVLSEYGRKGKRSLIVGPWHYLRTPRGREELYQMERDPEELTNLANDAQSRRILLRFRAADDSIQRAAATSRAIVQEF